jgi:hypothetical protein
MHLKKLAEIFQVNESVIKSLMNYCLDERSTCSTGYTNKDFWQDRFHGMRLVG